MTEPIRVSRWETEIPLLVLVALLAFAMWVAIVVSLIGIFYALVFALFFFVAQLAFIAHLRGSSIKLGPEQMPELYARVQAISASFGMEQVPNAYVMQTGGSLNALATKLSASSGFSPRAASCRSSAARTRAPASTPRTATARRFPPTRRRACAD